MAAFLSVTERITVGSGVVDCWSRNPARLAATFSTLDDLAPGRIRCGLGAWWDPLAAKVGIDRHTPLRAMREVVTRYEAASNDGNAEALAALYADDALVMPPDGGSISGHTAILDFWKDGIEPGISFEVQESHADGGTGFVAGRSTG